MMSTQDRFAAALRKRALQINMCRQPVMPISIHASIKQQSQLIQVQYLPAIYRLFAAVNHQY